MIKISNLTKDYGDHRGIFNINLSIEKGEVFGIVGTNGAGKTTTIRHLMGFLKPVKGTAQINGLDCWKDASEIKKIVGYVPGEISFPDAGTGIRFLKQQAELIGLKDLSYGKSLIEKLQLDPSAPLKRMSKGMKQKTAIVAAFMADQEVLILDEPTTGLDPLMRDEFIQILKEEKKKGKTIFMSSHMFEEVEETCDKVAMIKDGKIIAVLDTKNIKMREKKVFTITFTSKDGYEKFQKEQFDLIEKDDKNFSATIEIHDRDINILFRTLTNYKIKSISEKKESLEKYFHRFFKEGSVHVQ